MVIPLASLADVGVADGRWDLQLWPDHVVAAANPDVIVLQRQVEDGALDAIERWRAMLPNTLFVYELDDYLGEIPPASFHAGFMPPDLPAKIARAISLCDRVTTTTDTLAEWFRSLGATDVRVIPNGLPANKIREREPRQSGKMRIGFVGGMSHGGDLKLIEPAIREIGDAVDWVFFGTKPDNLGGVRVEYHEGTDAMRYLDKIATLDFDLLLAPLEDNIFNRCKSNLRLVESGAVGACVIAQDMEPYRINNPPVFAYANTPEEWTSRIKDFIASTPGERRKSANELRSWTGQNYSLEKLLRDRMAVWLPDGAEHFRPVGHAARVEPLPIVTSMEEKETLIERLAFLRRARFVGDGLESACLKAIELGADVLWLRPATMFGEKSWNTMLRVLGQASTIATVLPLASDGPNAFPKPDEWMPMGAGTVRDMERIVAGVMRGRRFSVPSASGACVLLSGAALRMLGVPDVPGCQGNEEQAIFEWGLRAAVREWKHMQVADTFASSLAPPAQGDQRLMALRLQARGWAVLLQKPVEGMTAQERETIELELLATQWGGPRPGSMGFSLSYEDWKAITRARTPALLDAVNDLDSAVKAPIVYVTPFGSGFASFGWCIHTDDSVKLDEDAMVAFSDAIMAAGPDVQVVYADHETLVPNGALAPEFKPDFDLELFLAQDYVTPVCAVRLTHGPLADRQELFSHILDVALKDGARAFSHIARTLGSMALTVKPEEMALDALARQLLIQNRLGDSAMVTAHRRIPGCLSVVRDWKHGKLDLPVSNVELYGQRAAPLVSIIVPTLGAGRLIQPCINTIRQHTDYPNYEIVVVQNGERGNPELGDAVDDPRVRVVRWEGQFNWSAINNWAIRMHAKGSYIVTMNDDVCVSTKTWLDTMMGHAVLGDVGAVGARLLHPGGFVQHVGVIAHNGIAGHMHKGLQNGQQGHLGRAVLTHEASAVTGACMLFRRRVFDDANGFDEMMPRNYNDTDFCLKLRAKGYRIVVEMTAELLHPEGASRSDPMLPENLRLLARENRVFARKHPGPDPYWNPNMMLELVHGGMLIRGLNGEALAWTDSKVVKGQDKVLIVNDLPGAKGMVLDVIRVGDVPMAANLSGFTLRMTGPIPRNTAPWDVRDPTRMREGLQRLGVTKIVLRSLVGAEGAAAPVEALRCLAALGIPVEVDTTPDGIVRPEAAENSLDTKVFGSVDTYAWEDAYRDLAPFVRPTEFTGDETQYQDAEVSE